jgi:hypothetical protein
MSNAPVVHVLGLCNRNVRFVSFLLNFLLPCIVELGYNVMEGNVLFCYKRVLL